MKDFHPKNGWPVVSVQFYSTILLNARGYTMAKRLARQKELEASIDSVRDSYSGPEEINNLESAALPNKRAVIDALSRLGGNGSGAEEVLSANRPAKG